MSPALVPVLLAVEDDGGRAGVGVDDGPSALLVGDDLGGGRGGQGAQVDGAEGLVGQGGGAHGSLLLRHLGVGHGEALGS